MLESGQGFGVSVIVKKLSWDEIKDLAESHGRTEIVDGELVVSPTPSGPHQRICTLLRIRIGNFVLDKDLGEFYSSPYHVVLAEHLNYEPDLCFIRKDRRHIAQETFIEGPPDLAIEVISESNRAHHTVVKFRDYARYGVQEYWLVDRRAGLITTWGLAGSEYALLSQSGRGDRVISRVPEGFELDPSQVLD